MKKRKKLLFMLVLLLLLTAGNAVSASSAGNKSFVSANRITKQMLDSLNLTNVNKVMIVAHPDDEMLWGGIHLIKDDYLVVCLTNANTRKYGTRRAKEFKAVLEKTHDKGIILNYPDYNRYGQKDNWKSSSKNIQKDLMTLLTYKNWKEVVTHNKQGEYGHIHHKKTNRLVTACFKQAKIRGASLKYFGKYHGSGYRGRTRYSKADIRKKAQILKLYKSQKGSVHKLSHMNPYENWTNG